MTSKRANILRRSWVACKEDGVTAVIGRRRRRIWNCQDCIVYLKSLGDNTAPVCSGDVEFRTAEQSDIPWMAQQMSRAPEHSESLLRQQFGDRDATTIGVASDPQQTLAFTAWLSHRDFALTLLDGHVRDGEASVRRVWVPPAFRGKGMATRGLAFTEYITSSMGSEHLWSFVGSGNDASKRIHEKRGFEAYGRIQLLTRWGKRYAQTKLRGESRWTRRRIPDEIVTL